MKRKYSHDVLVGPMGHQDQDLVVGELVVASHAVAGSPSRNRSQQAPAQLDLHYITDTLMVTSQPADTTEPVLSGPHIRT
jgi:hypothetical protein